MTSVDLATLMKQKLHTELFLDRETSWLEFNNRVLSEVRSEHLMFEFELVLVASDVGLQNIHAFRHFGLLLLCFLRVGVWLLMFMLQAEDKRNPLLERVKFLAIFSTNLDEFFMVRVAGILTQVAQNVREETKAKLGALSFGFVLF